MMKRLVTFLMMALLPSALFANGPELNPGNTFTGAMVMGSHWTIDGAGAAVGNGATKMETVSRTSTAIKKGHVYDVTLTVANLTTGSLRVGVGTTMVGSATSPTLNYPQADIADNFTYANAVEPSSFAAGNHDTSGDSVGAVRFFCGHSHFAPDDPEMLPGLPGRSHMHEFVGNTGTNANSTYQSLRTSGMTTCGDTRNPDSPIYRSAFWWPALTDGTNFIQADSVNTYYKAYPVGTNYCTTLAGGCAHLPNNLHYIVGYNFATGTTDAVNALSFDCVYRQGGPTTDLNGHSLVSADPNGIAGVATASIQAVVDEGCPAGAAMVININGPMCWDGVHIDTPTHRGHVVMADNQDPAALGPPAGGWTYPNQPRFTNACPAPVSNWQMIPIISWQIYFTTDAAFRAGKWHLSSDEMLTNAVPGSTFHLDYFEAWSPTAKAAWETNCEDNHNSCSAGALGDGTQIKDAVTTAQTPNHAQHNDTIAGVLAPLMTGRYYPAIRAGLSPLISANGTYHYEITAAGAQEFNIEGINGFDGKVTYFSISEKTTGHKAPVTIHN